MRHRWVICFLLFAGATINYVDRQALAVLKPTLQHELGWSEVSYGNIVTAFQAAYAVGMLLVGRFIDRVGTRAGLAATAAFWAAATIAHALVSSVVGFSAARMALGLGESGMFPAGGKAVAEWFPRRERSFAMALFNAGTNVGPIVCPLLAPWLVGSFGWRWTFVAMGALALAWIAPWLLLYRPPERHPSVTPEERLALRADAARSADIPWRTLLTHRQAWAILLGKLISDPIWWLYLFWIPDFLHRKHGLDLKRLGPPLVTIYFLSLFGGLAGGWLSSRLMRRGWTTNAARKTAMLLASIAVLPILGAARATSLWTAVALVGVAVGAHQAFSANLLTLASDMFPVSSVASVMGLGGMGGAVGGILIAQTAGRLLQVTGSYELLFVVPALAYITALAVIHALAPRLAPVGALAAGSSTS